MRACFISQSLYRLMVDRFPLWMKDNWPRLDRTWGAYGVTVRGGLSLMNDLRRLLEKVS